ncbi:MAG: hypothetical protein IJZ06_07965 [Bacteroidales bacterium]|nr:hypothetical protein [Bacteroidales bacterium]
MKRVYLIMALFATLMVSCVPEAEKATVETRVITDVTSSSARVICNVSDDGGAEVSSRGICWSTSENPTIEDNKTTEGSGTGTYTSNLTSLEANTTYYVRAYATNAAGTSYGEQKSFTTLADNFNNVHEYVDLGLPSGLKWATCNVGATTPEEYGNYYAWGETTTKDTYTEENSLTYGVSISKLQTQGIIDGNGNLTPSYDAATANWGGGWRMPTEEEMNELLDHCKWEWTEVNGVKGARVIGANEKSIFLPAAGRRYGSSLYYTGRGGTYWNSTPNGNDYSAYYLYFDDGDEPEIWNDYRNGGQTVRPITE